MSVAQAQREIDSAEFAEWVAFYQLEPFGEERADLRAGIISSAVANYSGKINEPTRPRDFMPHFGEQPERPRQTVEEMQARFRIASALAAGKAKG